MQSILLNRWLYPALLSVVVIACFPKTGDNQKSEQLSAGGKLAQKYCSTCHLPVDPGLLDKETWRERVLPAMAKQLGLEVWQNSMYYQNERSAISHADWMQIVAYYDSLAPEHLSSPKPSVSPIADWAVFSLQQPQSSWPNIATTTLAAIDPVSHFFYTSDSETGLLYKWNEKFEVENKMQLPSPAVQINFGQDKNELITCIGEMKALDVATGVLLSLEKTGKSTEVLADGLIRPIHTATADFNKDGLTDFVVSSFGHNNGGLYLIEQQPDKSFKKRPIRELAGATQSIVGDFNEDDWPDVMTLFAHGDEGIWVFTNDKKGGFETKNLLRFPPVYGSSSFQLADMNKDGLLDIVYTAGDNSDYSRILKPYHGVYIFTGSGDLKFRQTGFYPINGATKIIAADFDLDGDMDMSCIAFFPDFKAKQSERFIYFEQTNRKTGTSFGFLPHALPLGKSGRWICMDVNDIDGDGDQDVMLGNYSKGFLNEKNFKPDWDVNTPFVILKNNSRLNK